MQSIITHFHHITFFADGIQLYIPFMLDDQSALQPLLDCLVDIKSWMGAKSLKLNEAKAEIMVFGKSRHFCPMPPGLQYQALC